MQREINHLEQILAQISTIRDTLFLVTNGTAIAYPATSHYIAEADDKLSDVEGLVMKTIIALKQGQDE